MKLDLPSPFTGKYRLSNQIHLAFYFAIAFTFLICVVFAFEGSSGVYDFIFGSLVGGGPVGQCETSEGTTDTCQNILIEEVKCPRLLSQRTMVYISIFLGLFGIDHLYARNLQLFLPKMFLSVFLLPYVFERMLASLPSHVPRQSKAGLSSSSSSSSHSECKHEKPEGKTEKDGRIVNSTEDDEDEEEEEGEEIDATLQFDFKLLACFGFLLILTHVWWIIDIVLWSFGFYTTGLGGEWFGNPVEQCPLRRW